MYPPERIVCLTEETVETLYLLGEERRIVGVSGYAVRPPQVRREKPRVSAFISADLPKILALEPDLVLAFSDLQADICAALIRANVAVHERALKLPRRPRVYFEEWDDPMISGLGWVSELIAAAGGIEVFPQLAANKSAKDRIVSAEAVIAAEPDIIIGSWCGKRFVPAKVAARAGFDRVPAVATGWLREVKSALILQPGPAALTAGLDALCAVVSEWVAKQGAKTDK